MGKIEKSFQFLGKQDLSKEGLDVSLGLNVYRCRKCMATIHECGGPPQVRLKHLRWHEALEVALASKVPL